MRALVAVFLLITTSLAAHAQDRLTPYRTKLKRQGILKEVRVDGRAYCYADAGRGPVLLLLHGLGGSLYDWRHMMEPLSRTHRVIALDFLGAGESDKPRDADYGFAAQAERVRRFLDALGIRRATFVGNSYGGGVTLLFALRWPERVERMVLIAPACYAERIPLFVPLGRMPGVECLSKRLPVEPFVRFFIRSAYADPKKLAREEIDTYIAENRSRERLRAIFKTLRDIIPPNARQLEKQIKTLNVPAVIVWGKEDRTLPIELGRRLVRELPNAKLIELKAGHVPHQECPEDVLNGVRP